MKAFNMRTVVWASSMVLFASLTVGSTGAQAPVPGAGIYVADTGNNRIVRVNDMDGAGWTSLGGPAAGGGINQFNTPRGVSVDATGRIYVADAENNRILRVDDMTGAGWTTLGGPAAGRGANQFTGLQGIFADSAGRIYVAEFLLTGGGTGSLDIIHRIDRMDDLTGAGWVEFEAPYTDRVKSVFPYGVWVDATGRIYIADFNRNRIVRMNDMTGAGWVAVGSQASEVSGSIVTPGGSGAKQFKGPSGITVDANGRIYVADYGNNRVARMDDMTGAGWTALGTLGNGTKQFILPRGITVDVAGRIYVADTGNSRIVRINDMTGAGWTTYGSSGNGKDQFNSPRGIFVR